MTFEYLYFWILWFSFPLHAKLTVFEKAISIIHPWGALLPSPSERVYCSFSLSLIGDDRLWCLDRIEDEQTSAMGEPEVGSEGVDHLRPEQPHPPLQLQPRCLLACHRWDSCCICSLITHTHTCAHLSHFNPRPFYNQTRLYTIYILWVPPESSEISSHTSIIRIYL